MSIRAKVIGCFLLVLCLFGGVSGYGYLRAREANTRLVLVNELYLPLSRQIAQLQSNLQGLADDIRRLYFRADATPEGATFSRLVRDLYPYQIRRKFTAAEQLLSTHEGASTAPELLAMLLQARNLFDELSAVSNRERFDALYRDLRTRLQAISRRVDDECGSITLAAQNEGKETLITSLFVSLFVGLLGAFTLLVTHRVLSPLPALIDSVKRIADGDFNQSLKVQSSDQDEIAVLAREYNRMLAALSERDKKIREQGQELVQSERLAAVGQLSAEVVHEIRNPLNAISLNIDWLAHELRGEDSEIAKTLDSIAREIARLHQITETYLLRARVPGNGPQRTAVNELIRETLDFCREEIRSHGIRVETELSGEEIYLRTDRSRLKQALLNVLRNATDAMPRGGRLAVRTTVADETYRIEIVDSGAGMSDATRAKTFQPFFTTKPNGTGLGLTLTKAIVEEAQGTVQCVSQLGKGTTFTFQFPAPPEA